jgi:signal transduction histidine kinase
LKTPLAVITNEAREEKGGFGAKVAKQAQIMGDNINHYLDRARMAARVNVIGRVTPVAPVIGPLVRTLQRIHHEKNVEISSECPPDACFRGERQDLEEMLGNLLDNACKWARRNVDLSVEVPSDSGPVHRRRLTITVSDDGPGVSEEQRATIAKRGIRLDETKAGSGLGLSIVTDLAQSYGGTCELGRGPKGGLSVCLQLPAA